MKRKFKKRRRKKGDGLYDSYCYRNIENDFLVKTESYQTKDKSVILQYGKRSRINGLKIIIWN